MVRGLGSLIGMSILLLAAGYMAGYICGGVHWSTYHAVGRAVKAFWWAAALLFIIGNVYSVAFKKSLGACGILFFITITVALPLTGFYYAVGSHTW